MQRCQKVKECERYMKLHFTQLTTFIDFDRRSFITYFSVVLVEQSQIETCPCVKCDHSIYVEHIFGRMI